MKEVFMAIALMGSQLPNRASEPVVMLPAHHAGITVDDGGKFVQLKNVPSVIYLPAPPPQTLVTGTSWYVDIVNFGPNEVTIQDQKGSFTVHLHAKDSVRILSNSLQYQVVR